MSNNPTISVIMSALNASRFIREAIDSILQQSYKDFEFIIINDGSTDSTEEIIKSYTESRIVYIKNEVNLGLAKSFNIGIRAAKGQYIARMDADDISLPHRFETQLELLEAHQDIGIIGSSILVINENGHKLRTNTRPLTHEGIKWASLFSTPMYHPTIMGRAEIFKNNPYNEDLKNSEDYELWSRLLFQSPIRFANIDEPMLLYRAYRGSFTQTVNMDQRVISAHNTLGNIRHYLKIDGETEHNLIRLRQELSLSIGALISLWLMYFKAAFNFSKTEGIFFPRNISIFGKLISVAIFLAKHKIKHP